MKRQRASSEISVLRKRCKELGIVPSSNPTLMQERIRLHEQGIAVVTPELKTEILATDLPAPTSHHRPTPVFIKGEPTLLDIPHQVIQNHIFYYLEYDDGDDLDVNDLFECLYVCKYLYQDARTCLTKVAQRFFKIREATPLALSLYIELDIDYYNVCAKMEMYGSIEAYRRNLQRKRQLELAKTEERHALEGGAQARYNTCVEIGNFLHYPPLDTFFELNETEHGHKVFFSNKKRNVYLFDQMELTDAWALLLKMYTFINRGNPLKLTYSVEKHGMSIIQCDFLTKIMKHSIDFFYYFHNKPHIFQCMRRMFINGPILYDLRDYNNYINRISNDYSHLSWYSGYFDLWGIVCHCQEPVLKKLEGFKCNYLGDLLAHLKLPSITRIFLFRETGETVTVSPDQKLFSLLGFINFCIFP